MIQIPQEHIIKKHLNLKEQNLKSIIGQIENGFN